MFMRTYASSRVKRKSFYRNIEFQLFLWISGGHINWHTKTVHQNSVSIQSSTKVRETVQQITQNLRATKTSDFEELFIYWSFITFRFLGFFHWTVSDFFFCCVTVKTIYN